MFKSGQGSIRLFRFAGIDVFLHWSWLLVAVFQISRRDAGYSSVAWAVAEYLTLFGIVLVHEFGHALACRQVGGIADRIVLWPLGGIAFVNPPPRPGAVLWSIAAGPLVNVALLPITIGLRDWSAKAGLEESLPDLARYLGMVYGINLGVLILNMLPIFPLDGGQILQALLWFIIGRPASLMVVSVIGMIGGVGMVLLALILKSTWAIILASFIVWRALLGFQQARILAKLARAPRHQGFACPTCGMAPIRGPYWICDHCGTRFDSFESNASCPHCGKTFPTTRCVDCHRQHPIAEWQPAVATADDAAGV